LKEKLLPGKALELLDAAAAAVKIRASPEPLEIADAKKNLALIEERVGSAIENHEFEKAKFYQDEERKERENLLAQRRKHVLEGGPALKVGSEDVEQIIAKWAAYPYIP
jgi:ATP-dependent Clp protease ATP-binding subunit ClpC